MLNYMGNLEPKDVSVHIFAFYFKQNIMVLFKIIKIIKIDWGIENQRFSILTINFIINEDLSSFIIKID